MEKTLSNLRKDCKEAGISVKKQTLSWGPHVTFSVDGINTTSVMSEEQYKSRKDRFEKLREIKLKYSGMTIDGFKVYGLK